MSMRASRSTILMAAELVKLAIGSQRHSRSSQRHISYMSKWTGLVVAQLRSTAGTLVTSHGHGGPTGTGGTVSGLQSSYSLTGTSNVAAVKLSGAIGPAPRAISASSGVDGRVT